MTILDRPNQYDTCPNCGSIKSRIAKQCHQCYVQTHKGVNHPYWKGGLKPCPKCGGPKARQSVHCDKCAGFTGIAAWALGKEPWNKGKPRSLNTKRKIVNTLKKHYPVGRPATSGGFQKGKVTDEMIHRALLAQHLRPNKKEKFLEQVFQEYNLPYKYVGDGSFILGRKCPDFLNMNGDKKLIELFGNYWHRGQNPEDRINLFQQYGFETLVIWESELEDLDQLVPKLLTFG